MFKKNLMIVGLAGLMVLGVNMGVYADSTENKAELIIVVPSVITEVTAENNELMKIIALQPATRVKLVEYIQLHNPQVTPALEMTPAHYVIRAE